MLAVLAALVGLGCALAAARRLWIVTDPDALDPELVSLALTQGLPIALVAERAAGDGFRGCEVALLQAAMEPDAAYRDARLQEELIEADWAIQRWAKVPRIAASIATSAGFLFAIVTVIGTLTGGEGDAGAATLSGALNSLCIGIAAMAFCAAVHVRTRPAVQARLASTDRLVERLRVPLAPTSSGSTSEPRNSMDS